MEQLIWALQDHYLYRLLLPSIASANIRSAPGVREQRIAYGEHSNQYFILMVPEGQTPEPHLVVFIHGGEWRRGSPAGYRFAGKFFANQGYPVLLPGYRLAPEFRYPAQVIDVFNAMKAGLIHARENGIPTDKVVLTGHSAGGHLAGLLAYDKEKLSEYDIDQNTIKGLAPVSAPLDFSACRNARVRMLIADFMNGWEWDKANPIVFVRGDEGIPVMAIHGRKDPLVEVENSVNFARRVNESQDGLARLVVLEESFHIDTLDVFLGGNDLSGALMEWLTGLR